MDRHTGEPSGESHSSGEMTADDRRLSRGAMAQIAFMGAAAPERAELPPDVIEVNRDFFADLKLPRQLTQDEISALPDTLVVEGPIYLGPKDDIPSGVAQDFFVTAAEARTDDDDDVAAARARPVMRQLADRRAAALQEQSAGKWDDASEIARISGVPIDIVQRFIERNRDKLGGVFMASEKRRVVRAGRETSRVTEHFSPEFIEWAVASLQQALERYKKTTQES